MGAPVTKVARLARPTRVAKSMVKVFMVLPSEGEIGKSLEIARGWLHDGAVVLC